MVEERKIERPTAPVFEIELDKTRHLKFDFNALALAEKETGKNLLQGASWLDMSASDIRAFLWAGLLWEDSALTLEDVGSLIHPGNAGEVGKSLENAFLKAFPKSGNNAVKKKS